MKAYEPRLLPFRSRKLDYNVFINELLDATAKLEVYKEKIKDSKVDSEWFLPTLQQKEAIASTKLEGTQATLDGVLINQIEKKKDDTDLNEVYNYYLASATGLNNLKKREFTHDFFCDIHSILMNGDVRKRKGAEIGKYRVKQNYIGVVGEMNSITYIPPKPEKVYSLMDNLISYMNNPDDDLQPLIRTAIIHAQIETIHPFDDGNGRVGRIMIPLYLFDQKQISLPCFFISEALESDKFRYYRLLNATREKDQWEEWIKFFLETVSKQCEKYIFIIEKINQLYELHLKAAKEVIKNSSIVDLINVIYRNPILNKDIVERETNLTSSTINRYLNKLVELEILYSDGKKRNRKFYCYELLDALRI